MITLNFKDEAETVLRRYIPMGTLQKEDYDNLIALVLFKLERLHEDCEKGGEED